MFADKLIAHRGFQHRYPENTLDAISGAIVAGALNIELDVQFSHDAEPLIYHDSNLLRVSGIDKDVQNLPLRQLVQMPASEPERFGQKFNKSRIAPLSALLPIIAKHPHIRFFIELKRSGLEFIGIDGALDKLTSLLTPVKNQVVLISFNKPFATAAHQRGWQAGVVLENWNDLHHPLVQALSPGYVFYSQRHIPHSAPLGTPEHTLVIYEIATLKEAIEWFQRGADMVETFNIGRLLERKGP